MHRTHVVTASSTVKQERRLPLIEGMSVKDLADIQIKQLTNHKASLEGWERISSDTFLLVVKMIYSSYIPSEQDIGHKLKVPSGLCKPKLPDRIKGNGGRNNGKEGKEPHAAADRGTWDQGYGWCACTGQGTDRGADSGMYGR